MGNIIVSDFDGTITKEDTLYKFFKTYADEYWLEIERMWVDGKIGSKECLTRQFELVNNLNEDLINEYTSMLELDPYFKDFIAQKKCDFLIVSDGIDYFINKVLSNHGIKNINIVSNHAEFMDGEFRITFPNQNKNCKNKSGTCKCSVINNLKEKYEKIIYIGDGQSDFCVADKADILFAKGSLLKYCKNNSMDCMEFETFKDIII